MIDSKNAPRHSTRVKGIRYHSKDRAKVRSMSREDLENLPLRESMRQAINRGPNCFGDNTSYGYYCSGQIKDRFVIMILNRHVGLTYAKFIGEVARRFSSRDRVWVNDCINSMFRSLFGYPADYVVVNGIIVKQD